MRRGEFHELSVHHNAEAYLDNYLSIAGIAEDKKSSLFRSVTGRSGLFTPNAMSQTDVLHMIKQRGQAIGLPLGICCHTFRATGITTYLENSSTVEKAQTIVAQESPRTTKLYDRRSEAISLDEIERIII